MGVLQKHSKYDILIESQKPKGIKCIPNMVAKQKYVLRTEFA